MGEQHERVYGGQAVLEGVMMRGPDRWAVAVRRPDGDIWTECHHIEDVTGRARWKRLPLVRGIFALADSLSVGVRALGVSAKQATPDQDAEPPRVGRAVSVALVGFVAIFVLAPSTLTKWIDGLLGGPLGNGAGFHLVEQSISIAFFVAYVASTALLPDIRRTFEYHGAEHKVIAAWEAGEPLAPDSVDRYSTVHPRCGTNFLILVMILSMAAWTIGGLLVQPSESVGFAGSIAYHVALRVTLLPVVAGVAYEVLKLGATKGRNPLVRMLVAPGLALQRITTRQPDHDQIEVAIRSFEMVVPDVELVGRQPDVLPSSLVGPPADEPVT